MTHLFLGQTRRIQDCVLAPGQILHAPQRVQWKLAAITCVVAPYIATANCRYKTHEHSPENKEYWLHCWSMNFWMFSFRIAWNFIPWSFYDTKMWFRCFNQPVSCPRVFVTKSNKVWLLLWTVNLLAVRSVKAIWDPLWRNEWCEFFSIYWEKNRAYRTSSWLLFHLPLNSSSIFVSVSMTVWNWLSLSYHCKFATHSSSAHVLTACLLAHPSPWGHYKEYFAWTYPHRQSDLVCPTLTTRYSTSASW